MGSDPKTEAGPDSALSVLEYLWTATGKDGTTRVCDLFADTDPLVSDVEHILAARLVSPADREGPSDHRAIDRQIEDVLHGARVGCGQIGFAPPGVCTKAFHIGQGTRLYDAGLRLAGQREPDSREWALLGFVQDVIDWADAPDDLRRLARGILNDFGVRPGHRLPQRDDPLRLGQREDAPLDAAWREFNELRAVARREAEERGT
jgi:hypothetical protein